MRYGLDTRCQRYGARLCFSTPLPLQTSLIQRGPACRRLQTTQSLYPVAKSDSTEEQHSTISAARALYPTTKPSFTSLRSTARLDFKPFVYHQTILAQQQHKHALPRRHGTRNLSTSREEPPQARSGYTNHSTTEHRLDPADRDKFHLFPARVPPQPGADEIELVWKDNLGRLIANCREDSQNPGQAAVKRNHIDLDSAMLNLLRNLDNDGWGEAARSRWSQVPLDLRVEAWPALMLKTLGRHPASAVYFLSITFDAPVVKSSRFVDALQVIVIAFEADRMVLDSLTQQELISLIEAALNTYESPPAFSHDLVEQLFAALDSDQALRLHRILTAFDFEFSTEALDKFAMQAARLGRIDECINALKVSGAINDTRSCLDTVSVLLIEANKVDPEHPLMVWLPQGLLEQGLDLDANAYDTLIMACLDAGISRRALQLVDYASQDNIKLKMWTYSALLQSFRKNLDPEGFWTLYKFLEPVAKSDKLSVGLLTELFFTWHKFGHRNKDQLIVTAIGFYCLYFDYRPLKDIGMMTDDYQHEMVLNNTPRTPTPGLVAYMIKRYLKMLDRRYKSKSATFMYHKIRERMKKGDHVWIELMREPAIWNTLLNAFKHSAKFEKRLADILTDMTVPPIPQAAKHLASPCKPNMLTWIIILDAYATRDMNIRSIEEVTRLMKEAGFPPGIGCHNAIIRVFARTGEAEKAASQLLKMEQLGVQPDAFTAKYIRRLPTFMEAYHRLKEQPTETMESSQFLGDWACGPDAESESLFEPADDEDYDLEDDELLTELEPVYALK